MYGSAGFGYDMGGSGMMAADERLNGGSAFPSPYGPAVMPLAAVGGSPGVTAATAAPAPSSALGTMGLLWWSGLLVALVLSHTFTFELQS
jgi:hypothetical protein